MNKEPIYILFQGGESINPLKEHTQGVNFMYAKYRDDNDNEDALYSEIDAYDSPYKLSKGQTEDDFDHEGFDLWSYYRLRNDIYRQADEKGVPHSRLVWEESIENKYYNDMAVNIHRVADGDWRVYNPMKPAKTIAYFDVEKTADEVCDALKKSGYEEVIAEDNKKEKQRAKTPKEKGEER